jgi:ribosomal protein L14E/L6E/L27E
MSKLIRSLIEKEENSLQVEEELKKIAGLQGTIKSLMAKQEVIDLSKGTTKENVSKLLKERTKLVESQAKAKSIQKSVVRDLYPSKDKQELIPIEIRP